MQQNAFRLSVLQEKDLDIIRILNYEIAINAITLEYLKAGTINYLDGITL